MSGRTKSETEGVSAASGATATPEQQEFDGTEYGSAQRQAALASDVELVGIQLGETFADARRELESRSSRTTDIPALDDPPSQT